jgi:hypothetical protein
MSTVPIEVDDDLLKLADAQAADSGKPRSEVLAAALRRGLGGGRLGQILAANSAGASPSEEEALALAKAELGAARADRRTA